MAPRDVAALTLAAHFFPPGLLPLNDIESFSLSGDKRITVTLSRPGKRVIHGKQVFYARTITGRLELGLLSQLRGIHVREMMLKVPVSSVQNKNSGVQLIHLHVGPMEEKIPISAF